MKQTQAEYIDREKASQLPKEQLRDIEITGMYSKGNRKGLLVARSIINDKNQTPSADVVEVRHGEWRKEKWMYTDQYICSLCCSTVSVHHQSIPYRYCPYCGAKMDGKGDTE